MSEKKKEHLIKCQHCDGQGHYYVNENDMFDVVRDDGSKVDGMPRNKQVAESFARWLNKSGIWKPYTIRPIKTKTMSDTNNQNL